MKMDDLPLRMNSQSSENPLGRSTSRNLVRSPVIDRPPPQGPHRRPQANIGALENTLLTLRREKAGLEQKMNKQGPGDEELSFELNLAVRNIRTVMEKIDNARNQQ